MAGIILMSFTKTFPATPPEVVVPYVYNGTEFKRIKIREHDGSSTSQRETKVFIDGQWETVTQLT